MQLHDFMSAKKKNKGHDYDLKLTVINDYLVSKLYFLWNEFVTMWFCICFEDLKGSMTYFLRYKSLAVKDWAFKKCLLCMAGLFLQIQHFWQ